MSWKQTMCVRERESVCVCVCERGRERQTHTTPGWPSTQYSRPCNRTDWPKLLLLHTVKSRISHYLVSFLNHVQGSIFTLKITWLSVISMKGTAGYITEREIKFDDDNDARFYWCGNMASYEVVSAMRLWRNTQLSPTPLLSKIGLSFLSRTHIHIFVVILM